MIYTPLPNYSGPDSFTFRTSDGTVDSALGTVSISVTPVNDPPVAAGQSVTTPEDTPKPITLTGSDAEGSPLAKKAYDANIAFMQKMGLLAK